MTLYLLDNSNQDLIDEKIDMTTFIFVGKNWDYYFTRKVSKDCEIIKNCRLTDTLPENSLMLDYDRDQELFMVEN